MLNSYSSQTKLLNRFSHDEGLMDYATAKSKLMEIFFSTTAHQRLAKISLRTSIASQTCLLEHEFIRKTEEFNRKITQKDNPLTEIFWPYDFYLAAATSLPAPIVTIKAIMMTTSNASDLMK